MNAEKYIRIAAKIIGIFAEEQLTIAETGEILNRIEGTIKKSCVIGKIDYNEAVKSSLTMGK